MATLVLTGEMLDMLPRTPAGRRARWALERLAAVCSGEAPPSVAELDEHYTSAWLAEVPMAWVFRENAPLMEAVNGIHQEPARTNQITAVLDRVDGDAMRFRCAVEDTAPHRIKFQLISPAMPPSSFDDRTVRRDNRTVHVRDYGGDGPFLLLWHGAGGDATIWEALIPSLRSFRVVAQDLPGHGGSPQRHVSVAETAADTRAVLDDLGVDRPIVVGHSMGGWIAVHYAATTPCTALVCLDGPTNLDYTAMGITPDHPGWMPDPPDVRADLDSLDCPALITLCRGASAAQEEWMVPFRSGLADYLAEHHPEIRVAWQSTGHMNVLSAPQQTAELIAAFIQQVGAERQQNA